MANLSLYLAVFLSCFGVFVVRPVLAQELPAEVTGLVPPELPGDNPAADSAAQEVDIIDYNASNGMAPEEIILQKVAQDMKAELERLDNLDKGLPSLFFLNSELANYQAAILAAREGRGIQDQQDSPVAKAFDYVREISLGGIVLHGPNDWIVWLNKQRLTPGRLPPEIKEIRVYKDYVEMKWMDDEKRTIVPIRLRPNQRFNLDTMGFMPG